MELALEEFDVAALVGEVEATVRPLVEANQNVLEVRCPGDVGVMRGDLTRVRQILFNLLSNAAKFTQRGRVTLEVAAAVAAGPRLRRVRGLGHRDRAQRRAAGAAVPVLRPGGGLDLAPLRRHRASASRSASAWPR